MRLFRSGRFAGASHGVTERANPVGQSGPGNPIPYTIYSIPHTLPLFPVAPTNLSLPYPTLLSAPSSSSLSSQECNSLREQLKEFSQERKTSSQLIKEAVSEENKKAKVLTDAVREMKTELKDKNNTISRLEERCIDAEAIADKAIKELNEARADNERIRERNHTLSEEKAAAEDNLSMARRKILQLNDKIIDLQGNIRVFCRVRPVTIQEIERVGSTEAEVAMLIRYVDRDIMEFNSSQFEFDRIFPPTSSQVEVFDEVKPSRKKVKGYIYIWLFLSFFSIFANNGVFLSLPL
jgi:predicted  nucleic acid-binding Zn-ribbon protein